MFKIGFSKVADARENKVKHKKDLAFASQTGQSNYLIDILLKKLVFILFNTMDIIIDFFEDTLPHFIMTNVLNSDDEYSDETWTNVIKLFTAVSYGFSQ
jgi:hypothetical protein